MSANAGAAMERIRAAGLLKTRGLIGGQWVDAYDGKTIEVRFPPRINPAPQAYVLLPLRWESPGMWCACFISLRLARLLFLTNLPVSAMIVEWGVEIVIAGICICPLWFRFGGLSSF